MRKWRKQSNLERMEEWEKKGRTTVLCPTFLLDFSRVLVANLLLHVSIFFPCLASLLSLSYLNSPHKPTRLPILLHFSKMFPCPELFFLPVFLNFSFLSFLSLVPHSSVFSPFLSRAQAASFLLHCLIFPLCFVIHPSSCASSPCLHILLEIPQFNSLTGYLIFPRSNHCLHHPLYQNLTTTSGNLIGLLFP